VPITTYRPLHYRDLIAIIESELSKLQEEISSLEELSRHLFLEIVELRNMQDRVEWSKTWKGIYFNFLGYFFSLYCMWKIFIVSLFSVGCLSF